MERMDPCTAEADLELFAHDLSGIIFSDTPCKGAMQELRLGTSLAQGPCAKVNLVDNQVNQTGTGAETLYFDNIIILQDWTLEVGSFHIYYTNVRLVNGTVTRNGTVLDESEWDEVLKPACETVYGDFDCDGVIDLGDIALFCAAYTDEENYSELADSDCDLVVAGDADDLRLFRANLRNPDFACNNP